MADTVTTERKHPKAGIYPAHLTQFAFTTEQARLNGLKSIQARKDKKQAKLDAAIERVERAVRPLVTLDLHPVIIARARKIQGLIRDTELDYSQAETAKDKQALSQSLTNLYRIWFVLTGHEQPAIRKPSTVQPMSMVNIPMPEPMVEPESSLGLDQTKACPASGTVQVQSDQPNPEATSPLP